MANNLQTGTDFSVNRHLKAEHAQKETPSRGRVRHNRSWSVTPGEGGVGGWKSAAEAQM